MIAPPTPVVWTGTSNVAAASRIVEGRSGVVTAGIHATGDAAADAASPFACLRLRGVPSPRYRNARDSSVWSNSARAAWVPGVSTGIGGTDRRALKRRLWRRSVTVGSRSRGGGPQYGASRFGPRPGPRGVIQRTL